MPNTELPATEPTAKFFSYLWRTISGMATLLNTAADATLTPVTAAKMALDTTVAMPRPPGIRRRRMLAEPNSFCAAPEWLINTPIAKNSGSTTKLYSRIAE